MPEAQRRDNTGLEALWEAVGDYSCGGSGTGIRKVNFRIHCHSARVGIIIGLRCWSFHGRQRLVSISAGNSHSTAVAPTTATTAATATSRPTAVIASATHVDPPFSGPEAALSGYVGYLLEVRSDNGGYISAIDASIKGPLHQRWVKDVETDSFVQTPSSSNTSNGDSHLMPIASSLIFSAADGR